MIITIDGLAASGKGTLARLLAQKLNLPHMDSGRLYRALAIAARHNGINPDNAAACIRLIPSLNPDACSTAELRSDETGTDAGIIAAHEDVRAGLLALQRNFARQPGGAVLDGRDTGTTICPEADIKFWLHADLDCRTRRRHAELTRNTTTLQQLQTRLQTRDTADATRRHSPMRKPENAVVIDTTHLNETQTLETALLAIQKNNDPSNGIPA